MGDFKVPLPEISMSTTNCAEVRPKQFHIARPVLQTIRGPSVSLENLGIHI